MKKFLFFSLLILAAGCHKSELRESDADRVAVSFMLSGVTAEVSPTPRAADGSVTTPPTTSGAVALKKDATVRILVFKRTGTSADISVDTQVAAPYGEATYVVQDDGSLKPCNVDSEGKVVTSSATPAAIRLRADADYDFYAFTPAAEIADKTGANKYKVAIKHGTDHAASLTTVKIVKPTNGSDKQTVALTTLDRKCSQLSFSIGRKTTSTSIRSIKVDTVYVTNIAASPSTATLLLKALDVTTKANTGSFTFPEGEVTYDSVGKVTPFDCSGVVLPKNESEFKFHLSVRFNDPGNTKNSSELPPATVKAAFNPGYHYNFKVVLKGSIITLLLQVLPWDKVDWSDEDVEMGASPGVSIEVGSWQVENWDDIVGSGSDASIEIGGWLPNLNWDEEIAGDPVLSGALTPSDWSNGSSDSPGVGSSSSTDSTSPGNWGNGGTGADDMGV